MRRDPALLEDIVAAGEEIGRICQAADVGALVADRLLQAAVLHHITVIGEAASRLSQELRSRHTEIPWADIVSQRNRVVHDYFGLDWTLLWKTVVEDVPRLKDQATRILESDFSKDPSSEP